MLIPEAEAHRAEASCNNGLFIQLDLSGVDWSGLKKAKIKQLHTDSKYHQSYDGSSPGLSKSCFLGFLMCLSLSSWRSKSPCILRNKLQPCSFTHSHRQLMNIPSAFYALTKTGVCFLLNKIAFLSVKQEKHSKQSSVKA